MTVHNYSESRVEGHPDSNIRRECIYDSCGDDYMVADSTLASSLCHFGRSVSYLLSCQNYLKREVTE